jgi:branched-chain amino acid transport system ATP-binding protein
MSLLDVANLRAAYGPEAVLHGLDFNVDEGEVVVLLGANGAGKTTTLRALSRMSMLTVKGSIRFRATPLTGRSAAAVVRLGITHVPQGRGTFPDLTVEDNLLAGASVRRDHAGIRSDVVHWLEIFPRLGARRAQPAGTLSGGEQQMLALARAGMSRPALLLLDEPSLGLAPAITHALFERLSSMNRDNGMTMLLVEQNANLALSIAHRGYVLETGTIVLSGPAATLRDDDGVRRAYLGL